MKRDEILAEVTKIICRDRNDTHGNPENSFPLIAQAWTALLQDIGVLAPGKELKGSDVALMMAEFKACRQRINPNNRDNILDQIGYLAIYQELKDSEYHVEIKTMKMAKISELEKLLDARIALETQDCKVSSDSLPNDLQWSELKDGNFQYVTDQINGVIKEAKWPEQNFNSVKITQKEIGNFVNWDDSEPFSEGH